MREVISDNKKAILMDLVNQLENDLMDFIHSIEEDNSVPNGSFKRIDHDSNKVFSTLTLMRDEIYFT
jgi:hypothetical protein